MKTVEQKAEECLTCNFDSNDIDLSDAFKEGVTFAQRWISVEEEFPEVGVMVLTKMEKRHGDTWVQNYYSTATRLENQGEWQTVNWVDHSISFGHITHWRYIDIK